MKFRDMTINNVIVVGPLDKKVFIKELKEIHRKYDVIDLQYSVVSDGFLEGHCALALVRKKK